MKNPRKIINNLKINEIFFSIQGESSHQGRRCIFIRLTGCNLRCSYCDTKYAYEEGELYSLDQVMNKVRSFNCKLVEITGGEPLLQKPVFKLIEMLSQENYEILLETSGSLSIKEVPPSVNKIVDFKCPGSGMVDKNDFSIINDLQSADEIKFIITNKADFDWAVDCINKNNLTRWKVFISPVYDMIDLSKLADWILSTPLDIRLHIQLHKIIWGDMVGK